VGHEKGRRWIMGHVVVGIDGSESSRRALRWAMREAALRSESLEVVYAWTFPMSSFAYAGGGAYIDQDWEGEARSFLEKEIERARTDEFTDLTIEPFLTEARASEALIDRSKGAELLVVGSHGRGGFAGMLLGSVSQQVVQHAMCPVVVIRED
jgi:nucleotide-binding universal stress UspA family protein